MHQLKRGALSVTPLDATAASSNGNNTRLSFAGTSVSASPAGNAAADPPRHLRNPTLRVFVIRDPVCRVLSGDLSGFLSGFRIYPTRVDPVTSMA